MKLKLEILLHQRFYSFRRSNAKGRPTESKKGRELYKTANNPLLNSPSCYVVNCVIRGEPWDILFCSRLNSLK